MFDMIPTPAVRAAHPFLLPLEEDHLPWDLSALEAGRMVVLRFDALKAGLGSRWSQRRHGLMDQIKAAICRELSPDDQVQRVNETDFVLSMHSGRPLSVYGRATELVRKILGFLVGEQTAAEARVLKVRTVSDGGLWVEPVQKFSADDAVLDAKTAHADRAPMGHMSWIPVQTQSGRKVRASCGIDPVFELKSIQIIGHRLDPRAWIDGEQPCLQGADLASLDWLERERVDQAVLERGLDRMGHLEREAHQPLLVMPVAFSTLSGQKGRKGVIDQIREAAEKMRLLTLLELRDLDGVPVHRIAEVAGLLRPYCYRIVGQTASDGRKIKTLSNAGLSAVSVDMDMGGLSDAALFDALRGLATEARCHVGNCLVQGFSSLHQLAIGKLAGITHGVLRV